MTVYVLGCEGSRLVKIGYAKDPKKRLREISTMSAMPLRLLWQSDPDRDRRDEARLHRIFADQRRHGEWFDFGEEDPVAVVAASIDLPEPIRQASARVKGKQDTDDLRTNPLIQEAWRRVEEAKERTASGNPVEGVVLAHQAALWIDEKIRLCNEYRRGAIVELVAAGWSHQRIADLLGITRARVGSIIVPQKTKRTVAQ